MTGEPQDHTDEEETGEPRDHADEEEREPETAERGDDTDGEIDLPEPGGLRGL